MIKTNDSIGSLINRISKSPWSLIAIIVVLGALLYAYMITGTFKTLDDRFCIIENSDIRSFANIGKVFTQSFFGAGYYYRPLVTLSFTAEYHFYELWAGGYYINNILIHLASAVVIFWLIQSFFDNRRTSFFVALLFAIHPIHWEAVTNIPGRAILLCGFFYFLTFYLFIQSRRRSSVGLAILSWITFSLSLLSKESAAMMPGLLILYLWFTNRSGWKNFFKSLLDVLPFVSLVVIYLGWRKYLGVTKIYPWLDWQQAVLGFFTFLRSLLTHFKMLVYPTDLFFDRAQQTFFTFSDPDLFKTLGIFAVMGILFLIYRKKIGSLPMFFLLWFAMEFAPVSQLLSSVGVMPGYISAADHFLYTPSVGFFVLAVLLGTHLYEKLAASGKISVNVLRFLVLMIFVFLSLCTLKQVFISSQEISLFRQTLAKQPYNARICRSLAVTIAEKGWIKEAEAKFRECLIYQPDDAIARIGLGKALLDQERFWESIVELKRIDRKSKLFESENYATILNAAFNGLDRKYDEKLQTEPDNAQVYYSKGVLLSMQNKIDQAIEYYEKAVSIDPDFSDALINLASSYKVKNENEKALEIYSHFVQTVVESGDHSHLGDAYREMGQIYEVLGDGALAEEYMKKEQDLKSK